jgi:hypothetical protein
MFAQYQALGAVADPAPHPISTEGPCNLAKAIPSSYPHISPSRNTSRRRVDELILRELTNRCHSSPMAPPQAIPVDY